MAVPGTDIRPSTPPTRALMSGPNVGFYEIMSASVAIDASGERIIFDVGSDARVVAAGWYTGSPGADTAITFSKDPTPGTAAGSTVILAAATVDLDANPSGMVRPTGTSPTTLNSSRVVVSADGYVVMVPTVTAGPITNITAWILLWRTSHMHSDPTLD